MTIECSPCSPAGVSKPAPGNKPGNRIEAGAAEAPRQAARCPDDIARRKSARLQSYARALRLVELGTGAEA